MKRKNATKKIRIIFPMLLTIILLSVFFTGCINNNQGNNKQNQFITIQGKGSYLYIQDALNNATTGDIIQVPAGFYQENLRIDTSVTLQGSGPGETILDGNNSGKIISISADKVTIAGFTIQNGGEGIYDAGVYIHADEVNLSNNIITNAYHGIYLHENSSGNIIQNNTISHNVNGIYSIESTSNIIRSNIIHSNSQYGIYLQYKSDFNKVIDNNISNNLNGIRLKSARYNHVIHNIISNNDQKGIYICCSSDDNILYKNIITGNNIPVSDRYDNLWYYQNTGNYWGDYFERYPDATDADHDGRWDTPYEILNGENEDRYPLVEPL